MELGMFMQPVHDPARDYSEILQQDQETIILADTLGFREVWVGEHVAATTEPIPAPLVFLATLIEKTRQIRLGTGVFCLPLQHPATIASHAAMFDHLAKGRFQMGIGTGGLSSDIELFGVGDKDRADMVRESVQMMLEIWKSDPPYAIKGKYWNVAIEDMSRSEFGVGHFVKPLQQPHPPMAISIMSPNSSSARLAGEHGWIPISGANLIQPRYIASHWEQYAAGCEQAGSRPDPANWRVSRSVFVADSDAQAEDYVRNPDGPLAFWFRYILGSFEQRNAVHLLLPDGEPKDKKPTWEEIALSMVSWGSPGTVAEKIRALREQTGDFGLLTITAHEWDDPGVCKKSMRLLSEAVMAKLNAGGASNAA
jgi:alkanesulfonate monooxygenase SsuD/methylene tetrahydromethanopterin reductase-like flavin-dependent oxidoreductase (luciferase family)